MKVYIGADHGGFELKAKLKDWLKEKDHHGFDVGANELDENDDYVDFAGAVAEGLQKEEAMGVLLCRNGAGVSIVANRFPGVRCVLGFDEEQVKKAREDDDVNCLALPADYIDVDKAKSLVEVFLKTKFSGGEKYKRRLMKIEMLSEMMGCGGCGGECGCGNC